MNSPDDRPNFFSTLLGLVLEPGTTIESLLEDEYPRFALSLLLILLVTIFVPIIIQARRYNIASSHATSIASIAVVVVLTIVLFFILEGIFLQILSVHVSIARLFAAISYTLTPLTLAIWLIYGFNYFYNRQLSIITLLLTGFRSGDDQFLRVVPVAALVAQLMMMVVFYHCIRVIGEYGGVTSFFITVLSGVPLYVSLGIALLVAEGVRAGTIETFLQIMNSTEFFSLFENVGNKQ